MFVLPWLLSFSAVLCAREASPHSSLLSRGGEGRGGEGAQQHVLEEERQRVCGCELTRHDR